MDKMKAYCVSDGQSAQLIFANTNYEARLFGFKNWYYRDRDLYLDMRCHRVKGADVFAKDANGPYEEEGDSARRASGFYEEEDCEDACVNCKLHPFESLPESKLCRECNRCGECGCEDDCIHAVR